MPAAKLTKFLGIAPKISPELLPDSVAQVARNVKLYSGDLIPYRAAEKISDPLQSGTVQTIYPMRNPDDAEDITWLSWTTDVDVVRPTSLNDEEQRIYYTGDGVPKVTNYDLAVTGVGPFPVDSYDLGLPLPTVVPTATAASFTNVATSSYARDTGNVVTIVTSSSHLLRTGYVISVTSMSVAAVNTTNSRVTVVNANTLQYYNQGGNVGTQVDTGGTVSLAGTPLLRTYVYTWMTPWGEESIPSDPSAAVLVREGQVVTVANLPSAPPSGNNFIRGFRVYRTAPSTVSTQYFLLNTVWLPVAVTTLSRTSNVVTAVTQFPHNLLTGDKLKITGVAFGGTPDASFDVTDVTVSDVVDVYTFTYTAAGSNKAATATSAGTLYWDISEPGSSTSRYYESTSFVDDYLVTSLVDTLDSLYNEAPDPDMAGLVILQNNIMAGFVGNELCFSEVDRPWAWPERYRLTFPDPIVALAPVSGSLLVMTDGFPYIVSGSDPASMSSARIDAPYPCVAKRGVVNLGYGVVYPSHGGLVVYSPTSGVDFVTKYVHDWDTWNIAFDHATLVSGFMQGRYFGSHDDGAFIFERDEKIGGFFVDVSVNFDACRYDTYSDTFYFINNTDKGLYKWDSATQPYMSMEWKSKVITAKQMTNLGAARVVGDYAVSEAEVDLVNEYNVTTIAYNAGLWAVTENLGTLGGPKDYTSATSGARVTTSGAFNSFAMNGDPFSRTLLTFAGGYPVSYRLWANKELIFTTDLADSGVFRLPAGYRTDTFEMSVSGSARVRAIHFGETPYGLRAA